MALADNTWSELSTNFRNSPVYIRQLSVSGRVFAGRWVTLNVTGYVTAAGTINIGINTLGSVLINLASREAGNPPRLVLDLR